MMNILRIPLLLMLAAGLQAGAQKQLAVSEQSWVGYLQQFRFSQKWGAIGELHYRTADNLVRGNNLWLFRAGATYFINDRTQLTAGYAHFHYFPGEQNPTTFRPEQRGWQQLLWINNGSRLRVQNRIRLEERWRRKLTTGGGAGEGYNFNWRLRQQVQLLYPLGRNTTAPGAVALMLADEFMLNFGKEIVYNTFDQNRLIAGVQVQVSQNSSLQAGYMNIFQQQASGGRYRLSHVARIFYTHTIDLRKPQ